MSFFEDRVGIFLTTITIPPSNDPSAWEKIGRKAVKSGLHVTVFEVNRDHARLIFDNLLYPYLDAITYADIEEFHPEYAQQVFASKRKIFTFREAGKSINFYLVDPIKYNRILLIGTDLHSPSRLNDLLRTFLYAYGVRTENSDLIRLHAN